MPKPKVFNTNTVYTVTYNGVELAPVYEDLATLCTDHEDLFNYTNAHYALHRQDIEFYKKGKAIIRKREVVRASDRKEIEV